MHFSRHYYHSLLEEGVLIDSLLHFSTIIEDDRGGLLQLPA